MVKVFADMLAVETELSNLKNVVSAFESAMVLGATADEVMSHWYDVKAQANKVRAAVGMLETKCFCNCTNYYIQFAELDN